MAAKHSANSGFFRFGVLSGKCHVWLPMMLVNKKNRIDCNQKSRTMNQANLWTLLLLLLMFSCGEKASTDYIPEKHEELSNGEYDKYVASLISAYEEGDILKAALQLANLKGDKALIFKIFNSGIENGKVDCEKVYEWYWLYDRHNFGMNLVQIDTVLFKSSVNLCDAENTNYSYKEYAERKDFEEAENKRNKPVEDSTDFDMSLVEKLKQIENDDQSIRVSASSKNIDQKTKDSLYVEMQRIDSINLLKIDTIFSVYGYPSRKLVGKEGNFVPALVIHHSKDLETRYKYLPFLEDAVQKGLLSDATLNMIKKRIEHIELSEK